MQCLHIFNCKQQSVREVARSSELQSVNTCSILLYVTVLLHQKSAATCHLSPAISGRTWLPGRTCAPELCLSSELVAWRGVLGPCDRCDRWGAPRDSTSTAWQCTRPVSSSVREGPSSERELYDYYIYIEFYMFCSVNLCEHV